MLSSPTIINVITVLGFLNPLVIRKLMKETDEAKTSRQYATILRVMMGRFNAWSNNPEAFISAGKSRLRRGVSLPGMEEVVDDNGGGETTTPVESMVDINATTSTFNPHESFEEESDDSDANEVDVSHVEESTSLSLEEATKLAVEGGIVVFERNASHLISGDLADIKGTRT